MPVSKVMLKKLILSVVVLVVVIVMAARGCPRVRKSNAGMARDPGRGMCRIRLYNIGQGRTIQKNIITYGGPTNGNRSS
jgi:hypothetical protein